MDGGDGDVDKIIRARRSSAMPPYILGKSANSQQLQHGYSASASAIWTGDGEVVLAAARKAQSCLDCFCR